MIVTYTFCDSNCSGQSVLSIRISVFRIFGAGVFSDGPRIEKELDEIEKQKEENQRQRMILIKQEEKLKEEKLEKKKEFREVCPVFTSFNEQALEALRD
jgi:hypothetical protein